jgi:hypothetical protein
VVVLARQPRGIRPVCGACGHFGRWSVHGYFTGRDMWRLRHGNGSID